ncbi:MAG: MFS transporter [Clostridia bacterium]|nr:MFS transporter [Clostridia bacterium]
MMAQEKEKKSIFENPLLSTKVKSANVKTPELLFGYFLGPFGALLASGIFTSFLNRYWTDVLFANYKVDGELPSYITTFLTLLPLLSAILIVAGNLVVGQLIERTKTKAGKARPWLLLSSVFLAVACVVMFIAPMGNGTDTPVATMVITAIAYNIYYSIAYPMYNTANSTLVPVSTRNSSQRGLLASFTNFAHLGVMGAGGMVFPFIVSWWLGGWDDPSKNAWMVTFIAVGIFTFLIVVLQYYFTRERVTEEAVALNTETAKKSVPIKQQLKAVTTDKFWWIVIIFYLIFQTAGSFKNLSITYFCSDQFSGTTIGGSDGSSAMGILNILGAVPMAVAMAFIWPLSHKFGKRIVVMVGLIVGLAGGILAGMFPDNFYIVAVGVALKSFGSSPACYMILAMISDVLDHLEAKHGFRCDGFTMSIYSSIMAASAPIATGIFNAISNGGSNSTANTISYIWIETIVYGICAVLMIFFFVEKYLKDDRIKIRERQKAAALAAGEVWIEPEERLRMQEEEANIAAEEARKDELKARCDKKGLNYEEEEAKYQAKQEAKRQAAQAKKDAKAAKKVNKDNEK